jgi:HSP20 family protein
MALTFDPFREMDRMAARLLTSGGTQRSASWMPMDLYRVDEHYVVHVDLPGIDPGSIDLDVDATTLTIQAERTLGAADGAHWLAQERPAGRFTRQLSLGADVDLDAIHASYEHGVLTLTIPVAERSRPRKIAVEHAGSDRAISQASSSTQDAQAPAEVGSDA